MPRTPLILPLREAGPGLWAFGRLFWCMAFPDGYLDESREEAIMASARRLWRYLGVTAILVLWATPHAWAQDREPILRMELGTHSASIHCLARDPANRILVTGSEDKTARVWDIADGTKLLRTLRPPVGDGEQGHIFAVAMAPDGSTIACGGRTGAPQEGDGCVYLFDRNTGALFRRLGGLPGWVQHLEYTADGRFLAAVTSERGGKADWAGLFLFRLPDYILAAQDRDYGNFIRWVTGDSSGAKLATGCLDGFVRLYDLSTLQARDGASPASLAPVSRIRPPGGHSPWGLAFAPDGRRLAVGHYLIPRVDVLEISGNTLSPGYAPDTSGIAPGKEIDFKVVAWSLDGGVLYGGGGFRHKRIRHFRKWTEGGRGPYRDLSTGTDLPIVAILPLKAGGIVFACRDGSFGRLDDNDSTTLLSPRVIPVYAALQEGFLLSPDAATFQFAYGKRGQSPAIFSVDARQLTDASSSLWAGLKTGVTFQPPITKGMQITDWNVSIAPKLKGRPLDLKQQLSLCLAASPDRSGFLLGTDVALWHFDAAGGQRWRVRMPSAVWGINTDGRLAVAALADGTIRWYRLADGAEILAFFPHPERRRWILWTPSGYYDASPGGEDFIGWHVNNGAEQAADFFPASRFRSTYFRPDVIDRVLAVMDENEALRQANAESGRKSAPGTVRETLPPVAALLAPADGAEFADPVVTVQYAVRSPEPLTSLKVLVEGRPAAEAGPGAPIAASGEMAVSLPPRDCDVSLIALNRYAASEPATIRLRWKGAAPGTTFAIRPKLYVLAVGVSAYQDEGLRLDLAAKDARDFGAAWLTQKGKLYDHVEVRTLTDAQATKGDILDGLEWLQRQTTGKDVAVLFFAGHGTNDPTGGFYFLPVDADLEKLKRTGISQFDVTATVSAIAGKVLVFMDACHSGNLMGKLKRRDLVLMSPVINELASAENGAVVFSSATGRQYALENQAWGNGAFTLGVVEGLRGKADYGATGRITLNMLDLYVSERVKELTQGQQTPTTVKPPNVPDFPVAVLR
jgi:WD40 repeat protein